MCGAFCASACGVSLAATLAALGRCLELRNLRHLVTRVHDVLVVVCLQVVDALDSIPGLPKVTPVFVSLDPHRDSLTQMKHYKQGRP